MKRSLSQLACLLALVAAARSADLKQSKFTQVINDVKVVGASDKSQKTAAVNDTFKLPDLIRTGPASRAELVAEDNTITRVGANTIFSFDPANRTINLEKGSLLFHSPKGKGGGTIKTGSAVAAVLGTTIMVGATPDGGFKVVVLEGTAKVKLSNGQSVTLKAGQEVYVLPGGQLSPVVTVRLDMLVAGSKLVSGFDNPLPSSDLITLSIDDQHRLIESGGAIDNGINLGDVATVTGVPGVPVNNQPPSLARETLSPAALGLDVFINSPRLDPSHLFLTPTAVRGLPFDGNFVGLFARDINFVEGSQTVDMSPYHSLPSFTFLASRDIHFENSVDFSGRSTIYGDLSLIAAGTITAPVDSSITYYGSSFSIQALGSMSFDAVSFRNTGGLMELASGNTLTLKDSEVLGQGVRLTAGAGMTLNNVYIDGYGYIATGVNTSALVQTQYARVEITSGGSITMKDSTIYGNQLVMRAGNVLNLNNCYFGSASTVNLSAKTLILANIDFASFSYVYLQSQLGQLADNPNTGAAPKAGYVNFYQNVTYGGDPAQNHINPVEGSGIFISKTGQSKNTAKASVTRFHRAH